MKKIFLISIVLFLFGTITTNAQYPIPSFRVPVNGTATFREGAASPVNSERSKAKRLLKLRIRGINPFQFGYSATVWVYSLDGLDVLGPFTVTDSEILIVEIDDREWGALVETEDPVLTDVWIEEELKTDI